MPSPENHTQPAVRETTGLPDVLTIIAIAIVATVVADVTHEAFGHGGRCLLSGGHPLALSTVHFDCDRDTRWIAAGGTIANFIAGTVFVAASPMVHRTARLRCFLWLAMTINLLEGGGYFLSSGFGNIEDWAVVIQGLQPAWA
jgi:hypothetical protein